MSVIRVQKRENPYVTIDKTCLNDPTLSWKAKGLHTFLVSLPEDWNIYVKDLIKRSLEGRDAVLATFRELEKAGYLHREIRRKSNGQSMGTDYTVFEIPQNQNFKNKQKSQIATDLENKGLEPKPENPLAVNALTADPQLLNNKHKQGIKKTSSNKDYCKLENPLTSQQASCNLAAASFFEKNTETTPALIGEKLLPYQQQEIDNALQELQRESDTKLRKEICGVLLDPACFSKAGNDFYKKLNTIKKNIRQGRWSSPTVKAKPVYVQTPKEKTETEILNAELQEKIREIYSMEQALSSPVAQKHQAYRKSMEEGIEHAKVQLQCLQQSLKQLSTTEGESL